MKEGDVAVAQEEFRLGPEPRKGDPGEDAAASVSAPKAEHGLDRGVPEGLEKVLGPLMIPPGKVTMRRGNMNARQRAVAFTLKGSAQGFDGPGWEGARRGDQGDAVALFQSEGLETRASSHALFFNPFGSGRR
jgi:hypothetical protein